MKITHYKLKKSIQNKSALSFLY